MVVGLGRLKPFALVQAPGGVVSFPHGQKNRVYLGIPFENESTDLADGKATVALSLMLGADKESTDAGRLALAVRDETESNDRTVDFEKQALNLIGSVEQLK